MPMSSARCVPRARRTSPSKRVKPVAAGMVPASLGTQTAGSVVRPAAYCGIAAFKPTGQNMSTHGVVPLAPAFDTLGWFGHRFSDVAAIGAALHAQRFLAPDRPDALRVALPEDALFADASPAVMDSLDRTVQALARAGHRIGRTPAPVALDDAIAAHRTVLDYELSRLHGELVTEHARVLSPGWLAAIERGLRIPDEDHLAARNRIQQAQKRLAGPHGPTGISCWCRQRPIRHRQGCPPGTRATSSPSPPWAVRLPRFPCRSRRMACRWVSCSAAARAAMRR